MTTAPVCSEQAFHVLNSRIQICLESSATTRTANSSLQVTRSSPSIDHFKLNCVLPSGTRAAAIKSVPRVAACSNGMLFRVRGGAGRVAIASANGGSLYEHDEWQSDRCRCSNSVGLGRM